VLYTYRSDFLKDKKDFLIIVKESIFVAISIEMIYLICSTILFKFFSMITIEDSNGVAKKKNDGEKRDGSPSEVWIIFLFASL